MLSELQAEIKELCVSRVRALQALIYRIAQNSLTFITVEEPTEHVRSWAMATRIKSFLRRSLDAFIAAREREAEIYVSRALLSFDDETLKAHGYDRNALRKTARFTV